MDKDVAIKVENVFKKFCKSLTRSMLYGTLDIGKNLLGLSSKSDRLRKEEFWSLKDISFEVKRGETLGIIGPNGSGKTTLLKLLNGIFWPDNGKITVKGKVGALIELGAGFHPMLTGRENVYINAAILGISKKEIDEMFEEIINFAGINDFIDTPVKFYSSGMFLRLGFSIAIHSKPSILLIDEVLAVGDEKFQRQCLNKISQLQEQGVTIVFVSHELTTIEGFCSKVLWIEKGEVKALGNPGTVIEEYLKGIGQNIGENRKEMGRRFGSGEAEIIDIGLFNSQNERVDRINSGEEAQIKLTVKFNTKVKNPIFGMIIKNDKGIIVYGINTRWRHMTLGTYEENDEVVILFKQKLSLARGFYYVDPAVAYADGITFCDWKERALQFYVDLPNLSLGLSNLDSQISIFKK